VHKSGRITVERGGTRYHGEWLVERGTLRVSCAELGSKETRIPASVGAFEGLARVLLDELVTEHRFRKSG